MSTLTGSNAWAEGAEVFLGNLHVINDSATAFENLPEEAFEPFYLSLFKDAQGTRSVASRSRPAHFVSCITPRVRIACIS